MRIWNIRMNNKDFYRVISDAKTTEEMIKNVFGTYVVRALSDWKCEDGSVVLINSEFVSSIEYVGIREELNTVKSKYSKL